MHCWKPVLQIYKAFHTENDDKGAEKYVLQ